MSTSPPPDAGGGRYAIEAPVGTDGEWMLYRARHRDRGTRHLVRVLPRAPAWVRERVVPVVSALRKVEHPNVLPFTKVLGLGDGLGIVSPWVDGVLLADLLVGSPLTLAEADLLVRDVLAGVAAAAEAGVPHGGLDAGWVSVALEDGVPVARVTGFGVAAIGPTRASNSSFVRAPEPDDARGVVAVALSVLAATRLEDGTPAVDAANRPAAALAARMREVLASPGGVPVASLRDRWGSEPAPSPAAWGPERVERIRAGRRSLALVAPAESTVQGGTVDFSTSLNPSGSVATEAPAPARSRLGWAVALALLAVAVGAVLLLR